MSCFRAGSAAHTPSGGLLVPLTQLVSQQPAGPVDRSLQPTWLPSFLQSYIPKVGDSLTARTAVLSIYAVRRVAIDRCSHGLPLPVLLSNSLSTDSDCGAFAPKRFGKLPKNIISRNYKLRIRGFSCAQTNSCKTGHQNQVSQSIMVARA